MPKVKKDGGSRGWSIVLILFLGMSFFSILGYYDKYYYGIDDTISGMASLDMGGQMSDALQFIFGYGEDTGVIKLLLWIILFTILLMGTEVMTKGHKGRANVIALLVSFIAIRVMPDTLVEYAATMFGTFGAIIFLGGPLVGFYLLLRYWIPLRDASGRRSTAASIIHAIMWIFYAVLFYGISQVRVDNDIIGNILKFASYGVIISIGLAIFSFFAGFGASVGGRVISNMREPGTPKGGGFFRNLFGGGRTSGETSGTRGVTPGTPASGGGPIARPREIQTIRNYYARMLSNHRNIFRTELKKPVPNLKTIRDKVDEIGKYSKSIMSVIGGSALRSSPNGRMINSLCAQISVNVNDIIRNLEGRIKLGTSPTVGDLKRFNESYSDLIERYLFDLSAPIRGL